MYKGCVLQNEQLNIIMEQTVRCRLGVGQFFYEKMIDNQTIESYNEYILSVQLFG